jgi:CRP-like cAMP-binding protein
MPHRSDLPLLTSTSAKPELTNAVLRRLPDDERRQFLSAGTPIRLERREILQEAGNPMAVVVFPLSCVVSLQALTESGSTVEVAMLGRESVLGFPAGPDSHECPYSITVPIAGQALRFRPDVLRRAFDQSSTLRRILLDQWHALMAEIVRGSACHCFHTQLQRSARWLLAASERAGLDTLDLSHEDLGGILGVPRSAVTASAMTLRQAGAIRYHQGRITIVDRRRLSAFACECHRDGASPQD